MLEARTAQRSAIGRQWQQSPPELDGWRLLRLVGSGSWSQVYQATPTDCSRPGGDYLLKMARPELAEDPLANDMLWREAAIAARVQHPNLGTVLASQFDRLPCYLVMPFLEGVNVAEALEFAEKISHPRAVWIARQVAEALHELHREGWLHGDVKPANVFVATTGHTTLIDLGMARELQLTVNGEAPFAGTPNYAAPEWRSGEQVGGWSDIYSLGLTVWEMLMGHAPTQRLRNLDERQANRRPSNQIIPTALEELLGEMLADDPARRPSADETVGRLVEIELETLGVGLLC